MVCEGTSANGIPGIPGPPPGATPPPPPGPAWDVAADVAGAGTGACPVGVVMVVVPLVATMLAWVFITCAEEACSNTRDERIFVWKFYRSSVWDLWINQYLVDFNL